MTTIRTFEDIIAWQKARELTNRIYDLSRGGIFSRDFGLCDQIRRAAVSVMSNIAEGFERDGNAEFRQALSIAKGSAGEVRSQLYVALDNGYINEAQFRALYDLVCEVSRLIAGMIQHLKQSEYRGNKYR